MSTEIEYFAFVSDKNIVENVIVCNSREDFQALMRFIPSMGAGTWIPATEDTGRPSKGNNYHPNRNRFYPSRMYESWTFDEELWKLETLGNSNAQRDNQFHSHIYAFDINPEAVALTQSHLSLSQQMVQVSQADVRQLEVPDQHQSGLILINPPYGLRVSEGEETKSLLRNFAEQREKWQHWRIGMIYPRQLTPPAPQGLVGKELARFQHGGLPVWVWEFSHL